MRFKATTTGNLGVYEVENLRKEVGIEVGPVNLGNVNH